MSVLIVSEPFPPPKLLSVELQNATLVTPIIAVDVSSIYEVIVCPLGSNETNTSAIEMSPLDLETVNHWNLS